MGIFGALYAGVSGLDSQSNRIGIISNNISNVNTVGYKQGQAAFDTLVVPSGTTTFSPGGVIGETQNLVTQQGLIQATSSPTDVAITGNGFFVVNTKADGTGTQLLTRAGSFTQDSNGNFVNANGYYLQGIPVTQPETSVNLNNLKTVTINQNATGTATATSQITLGANLESTQKVLLGAVTVGTMQQSLGTSAINSNVTGNEIMTGNDLLGAANTNLQIGDTLLISSEGGTPDTFTYGGFTIGRDITSTVNGTSTAGNGGNGAVPPAASTNTLDTETVVAANIANTGGGSANINVTVSAAAIAAGDYTVGGTISIAGASGIGTIPAADINGEQVITGIAGNVVTFAVAATNTGAAATSTTSAQVANRTYPFTGNILNATTATADFLSSGTSPLTASDFTQTGMTFTITTGGVTSDFTYNSAPDPAQGTFNSLATLATAISDTSGLTARVANGRLYVSATDANQAVTFANLDAAGNGTLPGINWVQELDLANIPASGLGVHTFNSLSGLATAINTADPSNLLATVSNPNATAGITINEANPEQTIDITDGQSGSSILKELGIANLQTVGAPTVNTTGVKGAVYNPSAAATDMSSGAVTPQFSHDITVFDAQGNEHTIAMNVVKTATNQWAVEYTAVPATDVTSLTGDGQIASGVLTFNGDGLLTSDTLPSDISVNWTNGAAPSTFSIDMGLDSTSGVTQTAAPFGVSTAKQNGSPVGQLTGVSIDQNGFVTEAFSNGQTEQVFQVPLANVNNPDGLEGVSGDAFQQTLASGQVNLDLAGQGGTGSITPSALEQSNVDLSTQLTNLIVAQQAYGANSKLLTVADNLLQQLDQIIQ